MENNSEHVDCTPNYFGIVQYLEVKLRTEKDHSDLNRIILGHVPPTSDCKVIDTCGHFRKHQASEPLLDHVRKVVTEEHGPDDKGKVHIRMEQRIGSILLNPNQDK